MVGAGVEAKDARGLYLPVGFGRLRARASLPNRFWAHVRMNGDAVAGSPTMVGTLRAIDEDGNLLLQVDEWRHEVVDADARLVPEDAVTDWLYKPTWQPLEARAPAPAADPVAPGSWLVLAGPSDAGAEAERLRALGHRVRLIGAGPSRAAGEGIPSEVTPGSRAGLEALWRSLSAAEDLPDHVLCLWPLESDLRAGGSPATTTPVAMTVPVNGSSSSNGHAAGRRVNGSNGAKPDAKNGAKHDEKNGATSHAAAAVEEALLEARSGARRAGDGRGCWRRRTRLVIVTRGAAAGLPGSDKAALGQAAIPGCCAACAWQRPHLDPIVIDLDPRARPESDEAFGTLLRHLPAEPEVAVRDGAVSVRRLVRVAGPDESEDAEGTARSALATPAGNYRLETTQPGCWIAWRCGPCHAGRRDPARWRSRSPRQASTSAT